MNDSDQPRKQPAAQIRVNIDPRCEPLFISADVVSVDGTVLIARVIATGPRDMNPKVLIACLETMIEHVRRSTALVVPASRIPN